MRSLSRGSSQRRVTSVAVCLVRRVITDALSDTLHASGAKSDLPVVDTVDVQRFVLLLAP